MSHDPTPLAGPADDDPIARRLRRALHAEASMVQPSGDGLAEILEEAERPRWRRWVPVAAAVAAAAVVAVVAGTTVGGGGGSGLAGPAAPPSAAGTVDPTAGPDGVASGPTGPVTEAGEEPSSSPSVAVEPAPAGTLTGIPVYWMGSTATRLWVYREFRAVPDAGDRATSAVQAILREQPLDPDYSSPWRPAGDVSVTVDGQAVTVDLSADAFENTDLGSEAAEVAVQQLVYTVTAAAQVRGPVTVLVDGQSGFEAWGALVLDSPLRRDPAVQAQIWLDGPLQGTRVPAGRVTVSGVGTAFEGTLSWEVTDASGEVVDDGFTNAGANGSFAPFAFAVDLPAGDYTVSVWADDASGGESPEGPRMFEVDAEFTAV